MLNGGGAALLPMCGPVALCRINIGAANGNSYLGMVLAAGVCASGATTGLCGLG